MGRVIVAEATAAVPLLHDGMAARIDELCRTGALWSWEHRTGWRAFDVLQNRIIEKAFASGAKSMALVNPLNNNDMQILFQDMVQIDLVSGNTRRLQRVECNEGVQQFDGATEKVDGDIWL